MISFGQFLIEKNRSAEQIGTLFDKVSARQKRNGSESHGMINIPSPHEHTQDHLDIVRAQPESDDYDEGSAKRINQKYNKSLEFISMKHVKSAQGVIDKDNVKSVAKAYNTPNKKLPSIHVIQHSPNEYSIADGHHRFYAQKAMGRQVVRAFVYKKRD